MNSRFYTFVANLSRRQKVGGALLGLSLVAVAVAAAVSLQVNVGTSIEARASPLVFGQGADYGAIAGAGYASLATSDGGAKATLSVSGIPGASSVALTKLMSITNSDANGKAYNVTLARDAALPGSVSSFVVTITNGASTVASFDAKTTASSATFAMANLASYSIDVTIVVASGTSTGSLGTFNLVASGTPQ